MDTNHLAQGKCVPCQTGASDIGAEDVLRLHQQVPDWELLDDQGIQKLRRVFKLKNWDEAIDLANKISAIAIEQDHHPVLIVDWGELTVLWWTHKVGGLHSNDFIMAAKTDKLING